MVALQVVVQVVCGPTSDVAREAAKIGVVTLDSKVLHGTDMRPSSLALVHVDVFTART
jgi:ribulose-5-phosphate 4-epimerase/fuculose-1-phosphate aldolase